MNETEVEQKLQDLGKTAPRLTPAAIDACIASTMYHRFADTTLIVCCLRLKNGYCVTGESASASPENFDRSIGEAIAYKHARDKIWALEGYRLRSELARS